MHSTTIKVGQIFFLYEKKNIQELDQIINYLIIQ